MKALAGLWAAFAWLAVSEKHSAASDHHAA